MYGWREIITTTVRNCYWSIDTKMNQDELAEYVYDEFFRGYKKDISDGKCVDKLAEILERFPKRRETWPL